MKSVSRVLQVMAGGMIHDHSGVLCPSMTN